MRKNILLSLLVLGYTSVAAQVLILRELAASFYGNEFFTGWALFSWLFWTGLGSASGSRIPREASAAGRALAFSSCLVAVLVVLEIVVLRSSRTVLGQPAGALPDLFLSLLFSFFAIGPLCFLLGNQFPLAIRAATAEDPARLPGRAYFFETAGSVAGGAAFSFLLVRMDAFAVAALLFWINGIVACPFLFEKRKRTARAAVTVLSLIAVFLVLGSGLLEQGTARWRFPSETLEFSRNTLRGNIAITRLGDQHNFYQNGMLLGADREAMAAESLVHFPMLAHPAPRKVLFLGTGWNGPLKEVLKHHPDEVTAIDIDPELDRLAAGFLPEDLQAILKDPRLRFWHGDSRDFFRGSSDRFDVILADLPDPLSVLVNRYGTREFFEQVRQHLAPGGVFATKLGFSANYVTPELERLGGSLDATLRDVFQAVKVLPEDTAYFLASGNDGDFSDVGKIADRIGQRELRTDFVTPDYLRYRFTNDRVARVEMLFSGVAGKARNRDLSPQSYYFAFVRWLSQFHPRASRILLDLPGIPFAALLTVFLLGSAWPALLPGGPEARARRLSLAAMGTAGFTVMAFEIVLIYLFQVFTGDLYYRIAALITVMMAGIGAGAWAATRFRSRAYGRSLALLHASAAIFYAGLLMILTWEVTGVLDLPAAQEFFCYGAAAVSGFFAGFEFPFANGLYQTAGKGKRAGAVYAADLTGSCLGALLTAAFLIPVWGVKETLLLLAAMNVLLVIFLFFRKDLGRKDLQGH